MNPADGINTINERTVHVARVLHCCNGCGELIRPSHTYHRTRVLYDGHWDGWKHCQRCNSLYEALCSMAAGEYDDIAIDPEFNCGHDWLEAWGEDPPPEIAALAFALPGDDL